MDFWGPRVDLGGLKIDFGVQDGFWEYPKILGGCGAVLGFGAPWWLGGLSARELKGGFRNFRAEFRSPQDGFGHLRMGFRVPE